MNNLALTIRLSALRILLALLLITSATNAYADIALKDIQIIRGNVSSELKLALNNSVEIAGPIARLSRTSYEIPLRSPDKNSFSSWTLSELRFDEVDHPLTSAKIEGDSRRGYTLHLTFREEVHVELLAQYSQTDLQVSYAKYDVYKKLRRFPRRPDKDLFTINLETRAPRQATLSDIPSDFAATYEIYRVNFEQSGDDWQHLRLGFFASKIQAEEALSQLLPRFPDAKIIGSSNTEQLYASAFRLNTAEAMDAFGIEKAFTNDQNLASGSQKADVKAELKLVTPSLIGLSDDEDGKGALLDWQGRPSQEQEPEIETPPPPPVVVAKVISSKIADDTKSSLMAEAEAAFEREDYGRAIQLFTKLLNSNDATERQRALEMLGIARELNNQFAHAKLLYEEYLEKYPDDPATSRVKQRLAALIALDRNPKSKLRTAKRMQKPEWQTFTNVSQFYRRHSFEVNGNRSIPIEGIFNDINVITRRVGGSVSHEGRISASYIHDLSDRLDGKEVRIGSAYWDAFANKLRTGVRVGRQSKYEAGALGRFDGIAVTHQLGNKWAVGLVGGYSIDSSFDDPSTDRPFYGINAEYVSTSGNLILNPFLIQQYYDGILDRQAVGAQIQFRAKKAVIFSLLDYDLHHAALNNATVNTNYTLNESTNLNFSYNRRRSPYLTTRNALIGQPFDDLTELEQDLIDLQLDDLAADRTATSQDFRLGINKIFTETWAVTADVVSASLRGTDSSANVLGVQDRDDMYYSMQVRANSIYGEGTYASVLVRHADSEDSSTSTLFWSNRFRLWSDFFVYPRVRFDYRKFSTGDQTQISTLPSIRVDYRRSNRFRFELETGYEWTTRETFSDDLDINGFFVRAGYRLLF